MNQNIIPPKARDYLNLELWAIRNNLLVHPEYLKATRIREKRLVAITMIGTTVLIIVISTLLKVQ